MNNNNKKNDANQIKVALPEQRWRWRTVVIGLSLTRRLGWCGRLLAFNASARCFGGRCFLSWKGGSSGLLVFRWRYIQGRFQLSGFVGADGCPVVVAQAAHQHPSCTFNCINLNKTKDWVNLCVWGVRVPNTSTSSYSRSFDHEYTSSFWNP